ncbi:transcription initiation factor TFIID subunit 8-like [Salvia miltiorrhiza]|uniref:transcription initiation factor TFIID subunit 8-like n=1 Tax=Salvia miltiorrhiza TaxID=226208 RepID=UPI0025ABCAA6|nr:transcription initiation factor TFIID subunit 8-like [Salvia miltiorrhiza]
MQFLETQLEDFPTICQSICYKGAERSALESLTDIATRYLKAVAKLSAESANSSGRTESNLFDIVAAIEDLTSVQGFDGVRRVRSQSLWRSAVIRDSMSSTRTKLHLLSRCRRGVAPIKRYC